jgi:hypothetical protein
LQCLKYALQHIQKVDIIVTNTFDQIYRSGRGDSQNSKIAAYCIHFEIIDGHFVMNITISSLVIGAISEVTKKTGEDSPGI